MKADMRDQERLLDLQALDTRLKQIDHRLTHLPEQSELSVVQSGLREVDDELELARAARDDAARLVRQAEKDLAVVTDRLARNRAAIEAGQGAPAALREMGYENQALERREGVLVGEVEERRGRLAGHDRDVEAVEQRRTEMAPAEGDLVARRDVARTALQAERAEVEAQLPAVRADIPDDLLAVYDRAREQGAGLGAAPLEGRRCGGCRLQLGPEDIRALGRAPRDELTRCPECRRILVRIPQADPAAGIPASSGERA